MRSFVTICAATVWTLAFSAWALSQEVWDVYRDERYAMQISFPVSLLETIEERSDGVLIEGADAQLDMSARAAPGITSARQLLSLIELTEGYEVVTYSPGGNRWLVVSGYRGADIFYEKFVLSNGYVRGFSMQYPASLRRIYDPIVERMEDSFKVGPIVASADGFDREEADEYPVPPRGEVIRDERIDECQQFGDCRLHDSRAPNANYYREQWTESTD